MNMESTRDAIKMETDLLYEKLEEYTSRAHTYPSKSKHPHSEDSDDYHKH